MTKTLIAIGILLVIVGFAAFYVIKEKKKGAKCIGCPSSKNCSSCNCNNNKKH